MTEEQLQRVLEDLATAGYVLVESLADAQQVQEAAPVATFIYPLPTGEYVLPDGRDAAWSVRVRQ